MYRNDDINDIILHDQFFRSKRWNVQLDSDSSYTVTRDHRQFFVVWGSDRKLSCNCNTFADGISNCEHIIAVRRFLDEPGFAIPKRDAVKSRLDSRTAKSEEKIKDVIDQLKKYYKGEEVFRLSEIEEDNPDLKMKTFGKWTKEVYDMSAGEYLEQEGIIPPQVYFDCSRVDVSLDKLKGSNICILNWDKLRFPENRLKRFLKKNHINLVTTDAERIDYIYPCYYLRVSKLPEDHDFERYLLFLKRDLGILNFKILPEGFLEKAIEEFRNMERCKALSEQELQCLGISVHKQYYDETPDAIEYVKNSNIRIKNLIDEQLIPKYEAGSTYWSLEEFYEWLGAGDGTIREYDPAVYTCNDATPLSKNEYDKELDIFKLLCAKINDPIVQKYILKKVPRDNSGRLIHKGTCILAPFKYINHLLEYTAVTLFNDIRNTIEIKIEQVPTVNQVDDWDMDYERPGEIILEMSPSLKELLIENEEALSIRNKPGYVYIRSENGEIPERAFANNLDFEYVELAKGITKIGDDAFFSCKNLKKIILPMSIEELGNDCFAGCDNLAK